MCFIRLPTACEVRESLVVMSNNASLSSSTGPSRHVNLRPLAAAARLAAVQYT